MESLDTAASFMDNLLNFSSDIGEEDDDGNKNNKRPRKDLSLNPNGHDPASFNVFNTDDPTSSFPEFAEEELEWLSNKDAFPSVETFVGILPDFPGNPLAKHQSPVSVLENSTSTSSTNSTRTNGNSLVIMNCCSGLRVPSRARSKRRRRRRRDLQGQDSRWSQENNVKKYKPTTVAATPIGRKCQHCGAEKTPQWRAGPLGPKTLCNACGVRYKSGRLVPEYRPASSPTFSSELHSNSHRKIVEMRRQNQRPMGMAVAKAMDKG